jgi:hypothetical protein|tara:strand:- start:576 stop:776 length:201 start_codon:yes stop_codon:yes gene_type:complete
LFRGFRIWFSNGCRFWLRCIFGLGWLRCIFGLGWLRSGDLGIDIDAGGLSSIARFSSERRQSVING